MHDELKDIYQKYFINNSKEFIQLLELVGNNDIESVKNIIYTLSQKNIEVNIDNIKMILNRNDDILVSSTKSDLQNEIEENSKRHLAMYDAVVGTTNINGGVVA